MNSNPQNRQDKKPNIVLSIIKNIFKSVGTVLATFIMVGIITGCIVGSILTVYVLQTIGAEKSIKLDTNILGYTSKIYAMDADTGEYKEVHQLYKTDNNRIFVELSKISDYTKEALIAVEDKRFNEHNGVDWRRSAAAFLGQFNIGGAKGGGSTIHQQLIKNLTGDDAIRVDRKIQEIFRAINLSKEYTHDQVLEAYLNVVPFGAGTNGIESAANTYFGKHASELTLAESAAIVGITKYPGLYNPFVNPEKNKLRQEHVLFEMHDQKKISDAEYEQAKKETLVFQKKQYAERLSRPQSYFIDHVTEEVLAALMDKYNYTRQEATADLYESGYKIYITVDEKIQNHLESFYETDPRTEDSKWPKLNIGDNEYPQSASVILDHSTGAIVGLVGGRGVKKDALTFNLATMAKRQPGSTFKAIGPYALAFEYDRVTWSYMIDDSPTNPDAPQSEWYPRNYYNHYKGRVPVTQAITQSINTVAVKVGELITPQTIYDFLYNDLQIHSLVETDIDIAPMALGATTYGVTPLELAAAYQIFANGGLYTPPYAFTHVTDSENRIVLESDKTPRRVLSEDTAVLLNKLLQEVVYSPLGTGQAARIDGMPTGGKTGTSDKDVDQWFVGFTPYYVGQVWLGYEMQNTYDKYGNTIPNSVLYSPNPYPTPYLFRDIMTPIHEGLEEASFPTSDNVVQKSYCTVTGNLQGPDCPSTAVGWYKTSRIPDLCSGPHHIPTPEPKPEDPNTTGSGTGTGPGSGSSPDSGESVAPKTTTGTDSSTGISSEGQDAGHTLAPGDGEVVTPDDDD